MLRVGAALALIAGCRAEAPAERAPEPQPLPKAGTSPEEYVRRYAGEYVPEIKNVSNGREWEEAFMKKYAAEYQHFVDDWKTTNTLLVAAPPQPFMCSDMKCLDAWDDAQKAMIKQYVPEVYQPYAKAVLKKEYDYYESLIKPKASTPAPNASKPTPSAPAKAPSAPAPAPKTSKPAKSAGPSELAAVGAEQTTKPHAEDKTPESKQTTKPHAEDKTPESEQTTKPHAEDKTPEWYVNHYAGKWVPEIHNASDGQEWWRKFMHEYAQRYAHYAEDSQRLATEFAAAPASAGDCHTLAELKVWRDAQLARIKSYVPKAYQGFAAKSLDDEFDRNEARIAKADAAAKPSSDGNATHAPAVLMAMPENDYASQWIPHPPGGERASPEWYVNHFGQKYAGGNVPTVHNISDAQEWRQHWMGRYAEAYNDYAADEQRFDRKFGDAPQHASDCHTHGALERWHEAQKARIDAFVPKTYQDTAYDSLRSQFKANEARIARERAAAQKAASAKSATPAESAAPAESAPAQLAAVDPDRQPETTDGNMGDYHSQWVPHPMAAAHNSPEWYINRYAGGSVPRIHNASNGHEWRRHFLSRYAEAYQHYADDSERLSRDHADAPERASDAKTVKELEAWKGGQLARIDRFVPKSFQKTAKDSVEQSFRQHRAQLQHASSAQGGTAAPSAAAGKPAAAPESLAEEGKEGQRAAAVSALLAISVAGAIVAGFVFHQRHAERDDMEDVYMQV